MHSRFRLPSGEFLPFQPEMIRSDLTRRVLPRAPWARLSEGESPPTSSSFGELGRGSRLQAETGKWEDLDEIKRGLCFALDSATLRAKIVEWSPALAQVTGILAHIRLRSIVPLTVP